MLQKCPHQFKRPPGLSFPFLAVVGIVELYHLDRTIRINLVDVAVERGAKSSYITLAWLLSKLDVARLLLGNQEPFTSTMPSSLPHAPAHKVALDVVLSEEEITRLEELYRPHGVHGHV